MILINDDLIWVSIPKNASCSIENALKDSSLHIQHYLYETGTILEHHHVKLKYLYNQFGIKETFCVERDYVDRWLSALKYVWTRMKKENIIPIVEWKELNNEILYSIFDENYVNEIHTIVPSDLVFSEASYSNDTSTKFLNSQKIFDKINRLDNKLFNIKNTKQLDATGLYVSFFSQKYWTDNQKCDYTFKFTELNKLEEFISDRYSINFKIPTLNVSTKEKNNIVIDEKFRSWIYENFEKRFIPKSSLI